MTEYQYLEEDLVAVYHQEDPDLPTTKVKLPSLESFYKVPREEAIKKVIGYGIDPVNQHFDYLS